MKRLLKYLISAVIILALFIFGIDLYVTKSVKKQLSEQIDETPHNKVGLVLGTSKYVMTGVENLYYKYRIKAAIQLYNAGKIEYIIVSGDNRKANYNEPHNMMRDLVAAGIPKERIFLDYAGFRTLDSIVRCKAVFGITNVTIISQKFHNERALFIANRKGLDAIAYNAQDPPMDSHMKVLIREKFARVKMAIDLLINKQPKFFGPRIEVK